MKVWGSSDPPLRCPISCVSEMQGSSGRRLPWPRMCLVSVLFQAEAATPLPGKPPGCQWESAEVVSTG